MNLTGKTKVHELLAAHPAAAGQTVLMPASVPHAVNAPERFKMLLVMIRDAKV
jgi:quercetin dioxygenase-like cupin family protein